MYKSGKWKVIFRYSLLIILCGVIFWFSSNNGQASSSQSGRVVDLICRIFFPKMDNLSNERQFAIIEILTVIVRKAAHFSIYALLGGIAFAAFFFPVKNKAKRLLYSVIFVFLYACTDEFHQVFISERTGRISDVIIDTVGGTLGALIIFGVIAVIEARRIVRAAEKQTQAENSIVTEK